MVRTEVEEKFYELNMKLGKKDCKACCLRGGHNKFDVSPL